MWGGGAALRFAVTAAAVREVCRALPDTQASSGQSPSLLVSPGRSRGVHLPGGVPGAAAVAPRGPDPGGRGALQGAATRRSPCAWSLPPETSLAAPWVSAGGTARRSPGAQSDTCAPAGRSAVDPCASLLVREAAGASAPVTCGVTRMARVGPGRGAGRAEPRRFPRHSSASRDGHRAQQGARLWTWVCLLLTPLDVQLSGAFYQVSLTS